MPKPLVIRREFEDFSVQMKVGILSSRLSVKRAYDSTVIINLVP